MSLLVPSLLAAAGLQLSGSISHVLPGDAMSDQAAKAEVPSKTLMSRGRARPELAGAEQLRP